MNKEYLIELTEEYDTDIPLNLIKSSNFDSECDRMESELENMGSNESDIEVSDNILNTITFLRKVKKIVESENLILLRYFETIRDDIFTSIKDHRLVYINMHKFDEIIVCDLGNKQYTHYLIDKVLSYTPYIIDEEI